MEAAAKRGRFSGAVLIAQGDEVHLSKGYRMADHEIGIPNTPRTKFNIGNITRTFTAAAILQLQDRGLLRVSDLVATHLTEFPNGFRLTLHDLLATTAGIPSYGLLPEFTERSKSPISREELIALFKDRPPDFEPGTFMTQSASGYVLLGQIIERVSGLPYEDYIQQDALISV